MLSRASSTPQRLVPDTRAHTHDGQRRVPRNKAGHKGATNRTFLAAVQYLRGNEITRRLCGSHNWRAPDNRRRREMIRGDVHLGTPAMGPIGRPGRVPAVLRPVKRWVLAMLAPAVRTAGSARGSAPAALERAALLSGLALRAMQVVSGRGASKTSRRALAARRRTRGCDQDILDARTTGVLLPLDPLTPQAVHINSAWSPREATVTARRASPASSPAVRPACPRRARREAERRRGNPP